MNAEHADRQRTNVWRRFHRAPWLVRVPLKLAAFSLILVVTLYPNPVLFATWLTRLQDMNAALQPQHPGLEPFVEEVRSKLAPGARAEDVLSTVQCVVHRRIPYAWDWETWGVMDYLPTVAEALQKGREDCDGRAVVAASLLRRMDYDAELVSDVLHVWVHTPHGETMNPTSAERTLVGGADGTKLAITPGVIRNLGRGMAYGVGAFPLVREMILVAAICLLATQPRSSVSRRLLGCLLFAVALLLVRDAGISAAMNGQRDSVAQVLVGFALAAIGWLVLVVRTRAADSPPRFSAERSE